MCALLRLIGVICVASALTLSFVTGVFAQKWDKLAPFPEASEEVYGIAAGGKFHVLGGIAPGWTPKGLVYEYDPAGDSWLKKKNMPLLSHHLALVEYKGKVLIFGGFTKPASGPSAWVPVDNVWEYDPGSDSWKALAPMPTKRGSVSAAVVNGKVYVIGGAGVHPGSKETSLHPARPHRALDTNEVYDPETNTWATRSTMPTARNHAAVGVVNNKIYVIGGRLGAVFITRASTTDIVEVYDPATDQWGALRAPMPTARSAGAWGVYKGKIYVAGGEQRTSQWQRTFRTVEAYDPAKNHWTSLPPMIFPRHGLAGDILNGRFHLVSGDAASGGAPGTHIDSDVHEVLDLEGK
jgi:N-acetylneuraminic acid mutarotase